MLLKWYTFIKPKVILDALCGMDPEVVGFESTESSDKNLTMEYTSDVERDCLCCSLKSRSLLHVHDSSSQGSTVDQSMEGQMYVMLFMSSVRILPVERSSSTNVQCYS